MRVGDLVCGYDGWLARVLKRERAKGKAVKFEERSPVRVRWETGPLAGFEVLVLDRDLKVVG